MTPASSARTRTNVGLTSRRHEAPDHEPIVRTSVAMFNNRGGLGTRTSYLISTSAPKQSCAVARLQAFGDSLLRQ